MEPQRLNQYLQAASIMGLTVTRTPKKINNKYYMELEFSKPDSVEEEIKYEDFDINIASFESQLAQVKAAKAIADSLK